VKSCVRRIFVKTVSLAFIVCVILFLSSCSGGSSSSAGGGSNVPPPTPTPSLTLLQLTPGNASVAASGTQQFTATGKYSDGSSRDLTGSAQWGSSDSSVANVNGGGMATGSRGGDSDCTVWSHARHRLVKRHQRRRESNSD
jgi:Bacterial Ig-like domain (group 2)